nr:prepilin-type N-terminal cleavage/methylation domain-containing protein [uncultured Sphingomonas sp.]
MAALLLLPPRTRSGVHRAAQRAASALADGRAPQRVRGDGRCFAGVRPQEAGMTLIEMLIVLSIIAVAAGAVTLGIGAATRAPSVGSEAQRLADRLQAAADDAMLGDSLVAFTAEKSGYGFARFDGKTWQPLASEALGFHALPGGMTMRLSARPPVVLGPEGSGKPLTAIIAERGQSASVAYDGLTARVVPAT